MNLSLLDADTLTKYESLEKIALRVGGTPLIEVPSRWGEGKIFAKCEWENPTGTIKDRAGFAMLYSFLRNEKKQGKTILEYSGGSLGIALSKMCAQLSLPLQLVLPTFFDRDIAAQLEAEGTQIEWVEKEKGFWAVMEKAREMAQEPHYYFLSQHTNHANLWIHEVTTGAELQEQLQEKTGNPTVDAWVASIGTGATLMGVSRTLKTHSPRLNIYATTPAELPYGSLAPANGLPKFAGSGGLGEGRKQPLVEKEEFQIAAHYTYRYEECIQAMADFYKRTGLKIGSSSAANWLCASEILRKRGKEMRIATVFPSFATSFEREELRRRHGL